MKVAFYGAGSRAQPYLDALARRPDVAVSAVCDLDRRAAEQTAAGWGARVFLSYEAMLTEARPEALWICVPPHLQGDVILKAVAQQIPFFVEPPGAVDYDRARQYGQLVDQAGLVTAVGFPTRHTDVVREAREYLGTNPVPLALGWWLAASPEGSEQAPAPASQEGMDEPEQSLAATLLWSEACRLVDALRFFCGEVARVHALHAGPLQKGLVVQLEFVSGGVGVLTCAGFARPEPRIELDLLGDGWTISFHANPAPPAQLLSTLRLAERDKTTILHCLNAPPAEQVTAFLEAIPAGNPAALTTSYVEALRTLAVCQAAVRSAREGRRVALSEVL
jgi:predicted dehydrogenase